MEIQVLTSAKSPGISGGLTYGSTQDVATGSLVTVPLRNAFLEGIVLGQAQSTQKFDVKSIHNTLLKEPLLSPAHMQTMQWMSEYYSCSLRQALRPFLPGKPWAALLPQSIEGYRLIDPQECKGDKQAAVIEYLSGKQWVSWDAIRKATGVTKATMQTLQKRGIVSSSTEDEYTQCIAENITPKRPTLSPMQQEVYEKISQSSKPSLLFGITGSGKTEVYMQLIADAIEAGKQALVLVPEILLTEHSVPRYVTSIDRKYIAVVHSRLTPAQKREIWKKIRFGDIKLVIGSRSALFAPLQRLGIVLIDEEHEWTYKNEQSPRYHARDVADQLCKNANAKLVLGTATPSLESWHKAKTGVYTFAELTERFGDATMPTVSVVDLANVAFGNNYPFSNTVFDAIENRLQKKEQSVLFLNRRGMATSLLCMDCRRRVISPESNLPFTVHRQGNNQIYLQDHTSGALAKVPTECPGCQSTRLQAVGAGTQRIEDILRKRFPGARILRADSDTLSSPEEMRTLLSKMENNEADILLGTQGVVKGLDLPRVTLAVVLLADVGMSLPHFRAGERTFQLLTQLTGRSGRKIPGEVVIQTFRPDCLEVRCAALHQTKEYLDYELDFRKKSLYPPFGNMIRLLLRGEDQKQRAKLLSEKIKIQYPNLTIGCAPTFFGGGKQWHLLIRGDNPRTIFDTLDRTDITIDIDPLDCV